MFGHAGNMHRLFLPLDAHQCSHCSSEDTAAEVCLSQAIWAFGKIPVQGPPQLLPSAPWSCCQWGLGSVPPRIACSSSSHWLCACTQCCAASWQPAAHIWVCWDKSYTKKAASLPVNSILPLENLISCDDISWYRLSSLHEKKSSSRCRLYFQSHSKRYGKTGKEAHRVVGKISITVITVVSGHASGSSKHISDLTKFFASRSQLPKALSSRSKVLKASRKN